MSFIEWKSDFETGIHVFDEHHRHLVSLLNMAYDGITCGAEHSELSAVLDELIDYAAYHFIAEETWMEAYDYPDLAQHREEHFGFSCKIISMQQEFRDTMDNLSLEVLLFLQDWLITHILKRDAELGRFAKGLPPGAH